MKKHSLDHLVRHAEKYGGTCLSTTYNGCQSKYQWRCNLGHVWSATWASYCNTKSWCRKCWSERQNSKEKKKLMLTKMISHAKARGGSCLAREYISAAKKYLWKCSENHEWEATWNSVSTQKTWCKKCSHRSSKEEQKAILADMRNLASSKGGELLSSEYEGLSHKYSWRCSEGHKWHTSWGHIRKGSWCMQCYLNQLKKTKADKTEAIPLKMIEHAKSLGGEILSTEYRNIHSKYRWRCALGHEWDATWGNVLHRDSWCKTCSYKKPRIKQTGKQGNIGRRASYEKIVQAAELHGGKLISTSDHYINNKTKLLFSCEKGHQFWAKYNFVQGGGWCRYCRVKVVTLEDLKEMAKKFSGELISQEYLGVMKKHKWRCYEGHIFEKRPNAIKKGEWCSYCGDKISERICRATLEAIFKKPFPTLRPKWLASERGRMELDGYNEELGIAFEYHGEQHYKQNYFTKTQDDLIRRQEADKIKKEICKNNNVILLEIPYRIPTLRIEGYIKMLCIDNHLVDENYINDHEPTIRRAFLETDLVRMKNMALKKGGKCLSPKYIHAHHPLEWECKYGHKWMAKPNYIQQGLWCPLCGKRKKRTNVDNQDSRLAQPS